MIEQGIPGVSRIEDPVEEEDFPPVPLDLLEALEVRFPNRCPDLRISQVDYGVKHGQLEVVQYLRAMYERTVTKKDE